MSEQQIFLATKTHYDDDGDLIPEFGNGVDTFNFMIPAGKKYSRYQIQKLNDSSLFSGCEVTQAPGANATNQQTLKVKWGYEVLGKAHYAVRVFAVDTAEAPATLLIDLNDADWMDQAFQAIQQKKNFKLVLSGKRAAEIWNVIKAQIPTLPPSTGPRPMMITGIEEVALTATIVLGVIAIAGLTTIMVVTLVAINNGYNVTARHKVHGPLPFDDEIEIIITHS